MKIMVDGNKRSLTLKISPQEIIDMERNIPLKESGFLLYEVFGISELTVEFDNESRAKQRAAA